MRQFVSSVPPDDRGNLRLGERDYRYLVNVLRLAPGDRLDVRLGDGSLASMGVRTVDRKARSVVLSPVRGAPDAPGRDDPSAGFGSSIPALDKADSTFPRLALFQWMLKGPKMDQVVRQATEAGVALIAPVAGERCVAQPPLGDGERASRRERIVREALQQCGSPVPTIVSDPVTPSDVAASFAGFAGKDPSVALVLCEAPLARKSLHEYLDCNPAAVALAIGPEGGMSEGELALLEAAGFVPVHFRTNILRAETAALYGIAAVQTILSETEKWQLKE